MFDNATSIIGQMRGNTVKTLGVTSLKRSRCCLICRPLPTPFRDAIRPRGSVSAELRWYPPHLMPQRAG